MATFEGMAGMMKNMKPEDIVTIISLIQSGQLHLQEDDTTVQDSVTPTPTASGATAQAVATAAMAASAIAPTTAPAAITASAGTVTASAVAPAAITAPPAAVMPSAVTPANFPQQVAPQFGFASSGHVTQLMGSDVGTLQHIVTNPAVDVRSQSFGQIGSNNSVQEQSQVGVMAVQGMEGTEFKTAMQSPLPDLAQLRQQIALEKSEENTVQLLVQLGRQLRARESQSHKSGESSGIKAQMLGSSNQAGAFYAAGGTGPLASMIPSGINYGQVLSQSGSIQPNPDATTMSQTPHSIPGLDDTIVHQMQLNQVQHQHILEEYQQRKQQQSLMQQQLGMATQDVSQSELGVAGGFGSAALMHNSLLQTQQESLVPGKVAQDSSQSQDVTPQVGVAGSIGSMPSLQISGSEVAAGPNVQLSQYASQDASVEACMQQPQLTQGYPLHSAEIVQASDISSKVRQFGLVGNAAPSLVQTPMVQTPLYQGGALNQQHQLGGHLQQEQAAQLDDLSLLAQTTYQLNLLEEIQARTAQLEAKQQQRTIGDIPYPGEFVGYGSSTPLIQSRQPVGDVPMAMQQALGSTLVVDPESRKRKLQGDLLSLNKETPGESAKQRRINSGGKKKLPEKCYWCASDKHVSLDCHLLASGAKKQDGKTTSASATSTTEQKSPNKTATTSQSEKDKAGSSSVPFTLRDRVKRDLDLKINSLTLNKINYRDTIITDIDTLESRQKMIKEGRDMPEYGRYRTKIPRNERDKNKDPQTPDIFEKCSDHSWKDKWIKWRTDLKVFNSTKPLEKKQTKSSEPRSLSQSKTTPHLSWCSSCKCKVDMQMFSKHLRSNQHKKSRPLLSCFKCKFKDGLHNFQQHLVGKRHMMLYKDMTCPVCDKTFRSRKQYMEHNTSEDHKNKIKYAMSVFACTGCSFKSIDLDDLVKHIKENKEVAKPQNVMHNCTSCSFKCSDAKEYKKHLESKAHKEKLMEEKEAVSKLPKLAGEKETVLKRPKLAEKEETVLKRPKLMEEKEVVSKLAGGKETVSKHPKLTEEKEVVSKLAGEKETVLKRSKLTEKKEVVSKLAGEKETVSKRPKLKEKEVVSKHPTLVGNKSTPFDLTCKLCSFKCKNVKELEKHQKSSHHTEKVIQDIRNVQLDCHQCFIKLSNLADYEKHMLSPDHIQRVKGKLHMSTTGQQFKAPSLKCIQCQESFQSKKIYTAHIDSQYHQFVTKIVAKKQILDECTVCNIRFQDLKSIGEHLQDGEHIFIMTLSGTGGIKCVICQWKPSSACSVTAACSAYVKHLKDTKHVQHMYHLYQVFGSVQNVFAVDQPKYCNRCKNQFKCDAEFHQCTGANQIDPDRLCSIRVAIEKKVLTSSRSTNALKSCLRQFGEIIRLKADGYLISATFKTITSTNDVMDIVHLGGLNVMGKCLNFKRSQPKQITATDNTIFLTNFPNIRSSQLYSHFSQFGKIKMYNFDTANEWSSDRFGYVIFKSVSSALNAYRGGNLADGRSTHTIRFESVTCYYPYEKSSFKVLLKGLSPDITTENLQEYLSTYGKVEAMQVYKDVYTPGSEMYGIVTFDSITAAKLVVKEKAKHSIMGKPFKCLSHEQAVEKNTVMDEWFEGNLGEEDNLKMEDPVMDMLPPGVDEPISTCSSSKPTSFVKKPEEKHSDVATYENGYSKDKPVVSKVETACTKDETACLKDDSASAKDNSAISQKPVSQFFIAGKNLRQQMIKDYFGSFGVVTQARVIPGKEYGFFNLCVRRQQDQLKILGIHCIQGHNFEVSRPVPKDSMSKDDKQPSSKATPKIATPNKTDNLVPPGTEQETPIINITEQPSVKNDETPVPLSTKGLVSYPSVCITGHAPDSYLSGVKEMTRSSVSEVDKVKPSASVERKDAPLMVHGILNDNQLEKTDSVKLTTFVLYGLSASTKEGHLWQYFTKKKIGKVQSVFVARKKSTGVIKFTDVGRAEILKLTGETHEIMGEIVTCVQKLEESTSKNQPVEPKLADDFAEIIPHILQKHPNWKGNSRGIEYVIAGLLCNVCGWFYKLKISGQQPSKARAQHMTQMHFKQPTEELNTAEYGIEGVFCKVCNEFIKSKDRERALDSANDHCTLLKHHLNVKLNKLQNNRPLPKWLMTPLYSDTNKRVFIEEPPKPKNKPTVSDNVEISGLVHYGSSDEEDMPKDKEKKSTGSSLQEGNDEDGDADETDMVGSEWFVSELYDSDEEGQ